MNDLSKRSPTEREKHVRFLVSLPLRELRIRQEICDHERMLLRDKSQRQGGKLTRDMLTAFSNIDEKERDLIDAIDRKSFSNMAKTRAITRKRIGSLEKFKKIKETGKNYPNLDIPPRKLELVEGDWVISLDGKIYKRVFTSSDPDEAIMFADKLKNEGDVDIYITYSGSIFHDDSSLVYVYARTSTTQTTLSRKTRTRKKPKRTTKPRKKTMKKTTTPSAKKKLTR